MGIQNGNALERAMELVEGTQPGGGVIAQLSARLDELEAGRARAVQIEAKERATQAAACCRRRRRRPHTDGGAVCSSSGNTTDADGCTGHEPDITAWL